MSADPRIEDLTRMRALYAIRGPLDGQRGLTPDGRWGLAERWNLEAVLETANLVVALDRDSLAVWAGAKGLDKARSPRWSDQCPARGHGLKHARTVHDPAGVCVHCHWRVS